MNKMGMVRAFVGVVLVALVGLVSAQGGEGFRAAYVNSQYLLTLHPVYEQVLALEERARADVGDLNQRAQALLAKRQAGAALTADEQDVLSVTLVTLESVSARYDADIRALLQPAIDEITRAVADTAQALGVTMVFDYRAASESGVIVYADPETDITQQVAARLSGGE